MLICNPKTAVKANEQIIPVIPAKQAPEIQLLYYIKTT